MANHQGKGSCYIHEPDEHCPNCGEVAVFFLGSEMFDGPDDTEVAFFYFCEACEHEWEMVV